MALNKLTKAICAFQTILVLYLLHDLTAQLHLLHAKSRKLRKYPSGRECHECIIKWTQHIGFLTLAEMARVVEGNHGNDRKEG